MCETTIATREQFAMSPTEIASMSDTPAKLLALAIANQTPPETLSKLMDLQERWQANVARQAYVAAMSEFKKACPPAIVKHSKVDFTTGKGRTNYNYANLGDVTTQVTPLLAKHGLHAAWETAMPTSGPISVTCHITHAAGHRESVTLSGPADQSGNKNAMQAIGSAVTYLQRYTLLAALGLATMEDDDGRGGVAATEPPAEPPADPWQLALQSRSSIPALKALLDAAEKEPMPVEYIQAVKDKLASLTPATVVDAKPINTPPQTQQQRPVDQNAAARTAELARQVNQQFPTGTAGTVQPGAPAGAPPVKPAANGNGGKFDWNKATGDEKTAFVLNIIPTADGERLAKMNKIITPVVVGDENYRKIQAAMTAREKVLYPPEQPSDPFGPPPEHEMISLLRNLLPSKQSAADFDDMTRRWSEDSHSIDEPTYLAGVTLIQEARVRRGV